MPPSHESLVPARLVQEVGALSARCRADPASLYGQLLRDNVADVLRCSFPVFCKEVGDLRIEDFADRFVALHGAERPQFHHIATEFVILAQEKFALPAEVLSWLEYEWVLLAVEIDAASQPYKEPGDVLAWSEGMIALNPTSKLVVLPFDVLREQQAPPADPPEAGFAYAVFRTWDHRVLTLPLIYQDCVLIDALRLGGALSMAELLVSTSGQFGPDAIQRWVADGLSCDLLHVTHPKGGRNP